VLNYTSLIKMANTSSAKKAVRSSEKKRLYNIKTKDKYKAARRAVVDALAKGDVKEAQEKLSDAYKQIDKAAKKNVLHRNTASRYKSRLATKVSGAK
jgi:small subunit ribosomal protein S20